MELLNIFSAFGLSASAGLNAYIPLLIVALTARFTNLLKLSEPWNNLANDWVIGILAVLSIVEFFADKIPAVNHVNDAVQTIIRPVAGAILFAASANVVTDVHPILSLALGLMVSGGVHTVKSAAIRPAVTATTGGLGNIPVSILEDVIAFFLTLLSLVIPIMVGLFLLVLAALLFWWIGRRNRYSKA